VALLASCQEATEVRVRAFTDVAHADNIEVAMWVGAAPFQGAPVTSTKGPWDDSGSLGYIVAVPPSDNREANLDVRVVMGIGRDPRSCSDTDRAGCIVAKRAVRYLSRRRLELPVTLFSACAGVICDADKTCNAQGRCVIARVDSEACASEAGCAVEGDPSAPPRIKPQAPDAGTPDAALPVELPPAPPIVSYRDLDPTEGVSEGTLLVRKPESSARTDGFEVRWTDEDGKVLGDPFATLPTSDITVAHTLLAGTRVPSGADHFSVRSYYQGRGADRLWSLPTAVRADNFGRARDVGAQAGRDSFYPMTGVFDQARSRVVLLGFDGTRAPALRTCDAQGVNCTGLQLDSRPTLRSEFFGVPVFDATQRRIVFPVVDLPTGRRVSLLACDEDGKACKRTDLTALSGATATSAYATLDEARGQVFVVTATNPEPPNPAGAPIGLYRCARDGSGCTFLSVPFHGYGAHAVPGPDALYLISTSVVSGRPNVARCASDGSVCDAPRELEFRAGFPAMTWAFSSAVWDAANARLALIGGGGTTVGRSPVLVRCTGDLVTCDYKTLSTPSTAATLTVPRLLLSPTEQKLYVVSPSQTSTGRPILIRCALDGTSCIDRVLSTATGQEAQSGLFAVGALDVAQNRLYVFTRNEDRATRPWLFRCAADVSQGCTTTDMSSPQVRGETVDDGPSLSVAADAAGNIVLATSDASNERRLSLFSCDARGRACSFTPAAASQGPFSGQQPSLVVSQADAQRLVVTRDRQAGRADLPTQFTCIKDGACTAKDIAQGQVPVGQNVFATQLDGATGELRVLLGPAPYRLRCPQGVSSACVYEPLVAEPGGLTVQAASFHRKGADLVVRSGSFEGLLRCGPDPTKLCELGPVPVSPLTLQKRTTYTHLQRSDEGTLVLTGRVLQGTSDTTEAFALARCVDPANTSCAFALLETNTQALPFSEARVALDETRSVAYVTTLLSAEAISFGVTALHRCTMSNLACARVFSTPRSFRARPDIFVDAPRDRLLLATQNAENYRRPEVVLLDLW